MTDKNNETELAMILGRIRASADMLSSTARNLSVTADRVFGPRPEVASGAAFPPDTDGEINAVGRALDTLQDTALYLNDQAARFHRL